MPVKRTIKNHASKRKPDATVIENPANRKLEALRLLNPLERKLSVTVRRNKYGGSDIFIKLFRKIMGLMAKKQLAI
ncbi:MAG TPA: hypothetical protein VK809_01715, partial [Bacteroidia bacterium]|nr:hypothetical protein [Bacteroidia bacterium]